MQLTCQLKYCAKSVHIRIERATVCRHRCQIEKLELIWCQIGTLGIVYEWETLVKSPEVEGEPYLVTVSVSLSLPCEYLWHTIHTAPDFVPRRLNVDCALVGCRNTFKLLYQSNSVVDLLTDEYNVSGMLLVTPTSSSLYFID